MSVLRLQLGLIAAAIVGVGACITVNIYFPAPEVRAAAEEIVEETWGGSGKSVAPARPGDSSRLRLHRFGPRVAHAAEPNIDVSTAAIRAIKGAMRERSGQLKPYLSAGNIGIDSDGMLVLRDPGGISMKDRANVSRLVEAENADRKDLYREIATANDFGNDRIADIQEIFAQAWIEKAEPGWWVQGADGEWTRTGG